jgi:hypothetical protein
MLDSSQTTDYAGQLRRPLGGASITRNRRDGHLGSQPRAGRQRQDRGHPRVGRRSSAKAIGRYETSKNLCSL